MSDLGINFKNPHLACPDGLTVEAWLASNFLHSPISTDAYPPGGSPAASGTTSGGSCTLTGLSADAYQVSIIDESNKPTFFHVPASYIGSGTFTARYTPDAVTTASSASVLTMPFTTQNSTPHSGAAVGTNIPYGNNLGGVVGFSGQLVQAGVFSAGAVVVPFADNQFVWPKYASESGTWTWEEWVDVTDEAGVNSLNLDSGAVSISPFPLGQVNPQPGSRWLVNETGSDLVYHSGTGYKSAAGGFYIVTYNLSVIGNPGSMS